MRFDRIITRRDHFRRECLLVFVLQRNGGVRERRALLAAPGVLPGELDHRRTFQHRLGCRVKVGAVRQRRDLRVTLRRGELSLVNGQVHRKFGAGLFHARQRPGEGFNFFPCDLQIIGQRQGIGRLRRFLVGQGRLISEGVANRRNKRPVRRVGRNIDVLHFKGTGHDLAKVTVVIGQRDYIGERDCAPPGLEYFHNCILLVLVVFLRRVPQII